MKSSRTTWPSILVAFAFSAPCCSQQFTVGSNGSYGEMVFPVNAGPRSLPVPPDGIFNCTRVHIPSGTTLKFIRNKLNTPVYLLATQNILIEGIIDVSGELNTGAGGPGGFDGAARPAAGQAPGSGHGPGGARGSAFSSTGTDPSDVRSVAAFLTPPKGSNVSKNGGKPYGSPLLVPLIGGSGAGALVVTDLGVLASGGGGGGAILIGSDTKVEILGSILAKGGSFSAGISCGSGGAVRILAPEVSGTGLISCVGGTDNLTGPVGGDGGIRIDTMDAKNMRITTQGVYSIGRFMTVFPPTITRIQILKVDSIDVDQSAAEPVSVILPFGSPSRQTVKLRGTGFVGEVPIEVALVPDHGPSSRFQLALTGQAGVATEVETEVDMPINVKTRLYVWTVVGR